MRLRDLKRFVRALLPNVHITSSRRLPGSVMGLAWLTDAGPVIAYAQGMTERDRDLTLLHELAHHVYGDTRMRSPYGRVPDASTLSDDEARAEVARVLPIWLREQWREDRADRWAEETLQLLEGT